MQVFVKDRAFYKTIFAIGMPIAIQNMITVGVNLLDSIMLGSFGEYQLSASSLGGQFFNLFHIICMGICMGASVLLSRFWGEKDISSFHKVITIVMRVSMVIIALFTVANCCFPRLIMKSYTNDEKIILYGVQYLTVVGSTYFLHGLSLSCTIVMRCAGKVKIALYASIASFAANIFFNWIFIFGKLGAPRLEIVGAGIGTVIARFVEFAIICGYFFLYEKDIRYRVRQVLQKCGDMLRPCIQVALPVFGSDSMLALGNNMMSMIMGRISAGFVSAYSITSMVVQLSTVFILGMAHASCVQTGHALGEGKKNEVKKMGTTYLALAVLIGAVGGMFIIAVRGSVIGLYNITDETKKIAAELMLAVAITLIFQSVGAVMTKGVLRGGGDTCFLLIADLAFLWLAAIPLGFCAGIVWKLSPIWIMCCLRVDNVLKSIFCVWRLYSGKWIRAIR